LFAVPVPRLALAAGASGAHACALHTQLQRHVGALHDLVAASSAIRIDPADLCTVAGNQTDVALATSYARGPRRAALAAQQLVQAPGDSLALREARQMLLKVTVGAQDSLAEVETAAHIVVTAQHPDANVILGVAVDETLADGLRLTAVAAGFPGRDTAVWRWRRLWQPHGRPQPLRHAFFDRADHFLRFLVRAVRV
ncbi:MAG: hypothetical protein KC425_08690, partial [Anaerolineales bacterium]|nr:hypothetical protein [Anaerolineales bacterium]